MKTLKLKTKDIRGHVLLKRVIPQLKRRYRETNYSAAAREYYSKYLSLEDCAKCNGTRLCEAARNTFTENKNLSEIISITISESINFFSK